MRHGRRGIGELQSGNNTDGEGGTTNDDGIGEGGAANVDRVGDDGGGAVDTTGEVAN